MISERTCDTEDWNNENVALPLFLNCNISQYHCLIVQKQN